MKAKKIILPIVMVAVGYALGVAIGWPNEGVFTKGEIGKSLKFKKGVSSSNINTVEGRLQTDSIYRVQTLISMLYIDSRINEFGEYAKCAVKASEGIEELSKTNANMQKMIEMSSNADNSSKAAIESLRLLIDGDMSQNFEMLSNNAMISYQRLNRSMAVAKEFINSVDSFLKGKNKNLYSDLAFSRDLWVNYAYFDAAIDSKDDELAKYWSSKPSLLSSEEFDNSLLNLDSSSFKTVLLGSQFNVGVASVLNNRNTEGQTIFKNSNILGITNNESLNVTIKRNSESLNNSNALSNLEVLKGYSWNNEMLGMALMNIEMLGVAFPITE